MSNRILSWLLRVKRSNVTNYTWEHWLPFIDNWIPRFSVVVPVVGYLILLSDDVTQFFQYSQIVDSTYLLGGLDATERLRFVFFGLWFLAISNLIFRLRGPSVLKIARTSILYRSVSYDVNTFLDYYELVGRLEVLRPLSEYQSGAKEIWSSFDRSADMWSDDAQAYQANNSWDEAKSSHGAFLRELLKWDFYARVCENRVLSLCVFVSLSLGMSFWLFPVSTFSGRCSSLHSSRVINREMTKFPPAPIQLTPDKQDV